MLAVILVTFLSRCQLFLHVLMPGFQEVYLDLLVWDNNGTSSNTMNEFFLLMVWLIELV